MQTAMTRWAPTSDLFRTNFNRMLDQTFKDLFGGEEVTTRGWVPAVDIRETADVLSLFVELPGMKREDVEITLENHVLTVRGERKFEKEVNQENYHRIERSYGTFARSFTLPHNVEVSKVDAAFSDGVLRIDLPKAEESKPRKIDIK